MKVIVLNCGNMKPRGARVFVPALETVPCNCLLVEAGECLVLVDSGLGTRDIEDPSRLGRSNALLNAGRDPELPAVRQVERMGFRAEDVGHVICTHLDRDHAGGLSDFPRARIHVLREERDAAFNPTGHRQRDRYRKSHFSHGPEWVAHQAAPTSEWKGLGCIDEPEGLPPGFLLVPLPGHTPGHCGVAVDTGAGWVLHCGDSYYVSAELSKGTAVPAGVRAFRRLAHLDFPTSMRQLDRLRALRLEHPGPMTLVASHDPSVRVGALTPGGD